MSAIYFAIPTNAGQAKIANAIALGVPLKITHMAVGDGNGQPVTPDPAQTKLVREQRRAPLNALFQDPLNPAQLVAQQIIPENEGGWWIHEVGLFDESGTLIAIANAPPTYKPQMSEGSGRTQGINVVLIVSDTSAVELKIDPAVVLATRKYVEDVIAAHKLSRDHPDASDTAKGFTRHATQAEVNETNAANQKADAVVTVKTLWGWVRQASESALGMMKVASQSETDTGDEDAKAITPKKLKAWAKTASETVLGFIKIATQSAVNAGQNATDAVTPKTLMAGFSCSIGAVGYIVLPLWCKSLTLQWGRFSKSVEPQRLTFPVPFVTDVYFICSSIDAASTGYVEVTGPASVNTTGFNVSSVYYSASGFALLNSGSHWWFALGV